MHLAVVDADVDVDAGIDVDVDVGIDEFKTPVSYQVEDPRVPPPPPPSPPPPLPPKCSNWRWFPLK